MASRVTSRPNNLKRRCSSPHIKYSDIDVTSSLSLSLSLRDVKITYLQYVKQYKIYRYYHRHVDILHVSKHVDVILSMIVQQSYVNDFAINNWSVMEVEYSVRYFIYAKKRIIYTSRVFDVTLKSLFQAAEPAVD